MASYFSFIEKALLSLGLNFGSCERKFDKHLKIFSMAIVSLAAAQNILYLLTADKFDLKVANAFTIALFSIQGSVKIASVLLNFAKIKEIKETLSQLTNTLKIEGDVEHAKQLNQFRKVTKLVLITNLSCIWIFLLKPLIEIVFSLLATGTIVKNLPFAFYYPVNETEYFFPIYLYEIVAGHILTIIPLTMDGLILLLVGQIVVLFQTVGETFGKTINDFEISMRSVTNKNIKDAIELHNKIFDISNELFGIYEIALLLNALLQTGTICFIAFIVSTQSMDIVIPSLFGLMNSIGQVFVICWFGEKIKENSLNVAEKILKSNFHTLEPKIQRSLILIILRSQTPTFLKASKFFKLKLSVFTSIVRTAFSYFTLVKHLYSK